MKRHILSGPLLAFSASSYGHARCDIDLDGWSKFRISFEVETFEACAPPFPDSHVTTYTKGSIRGAPRSYVLDENNSIFSGAGESLAQDKPQSKAAPAPQGIGATDITADQSGRYLYIATNGTNDISAWQVDPGSGELTAIPGAPFKTGKDPSAVVVHPSNQFLYTADFSAATISWFRIDPATGAAFLYALDNVAKTVSVFKIDRATGALSAVAGSPYAIGSNPVWLSVSPTGRFVLVADPGSLRNEGTDRIWIHAVDAVTGALTPIAGSPLATPPGINTPGVIAINAVSPKSFARLGADYANTTFHGKAGTPPYAWSISNGALPPGLVQNAQTGVISGLPTQKGTFDFTVKVADAAGLNARLGYFITVNDTGLPGSIARVVEYYHKGLDNYFITADPVEQAAVDAGAAGTAWQRTRGTFKAGGTSPVCRFYGNNNINPATGTRFGPNSHFYTADAAECAGLKAACTAAGKSWSFESNDFNTTPAVNGGCAPGLVPVYRAYNNGFARGIDSNHRITSSQAVIADMVARGWISEGVVMCAPT